MEVYRYSFEPYKGIKTKHICTKCGKRTFTKYIDNETGEYIADEVGRCDREDACSYHYKPKQYFQDSGIDFLSFGNSRHIFTRSQKVYIPLEILKQSLKAYERNSFIIHLRTLFDDRTIAKLIETYCLGSSNGRWPGACLFWFIDIKARIHAGQVKLFDSNGHTAKYFVVDQKHSCTTWIHSILKSKLNPLPEWLTEYINQDKRVECFFGEQLLKNSVKPVAIVEAPATAIIASVYLPQCTWIAAGSLSYLTPQKCEVLRGRRVTLYPDLGGFEKWKPIADKMGFKISDILEKIATQEEREKGLDLRDYLERYGVNEFLRLSATVQNDFETKTTVGNSEYDLSGGVIHPVKGYPISWDIKPPNMWANRQKQRTIIRRYPKIYNNKQIILV